MKQKHIINVGFPKCGTTWLWNQVYAHPSVANISLKENNAFLDNVDIEQYKSYYGNNAVTANFHVMHWVIDQELIQKLDTCASHVSIILRNPYDFIERWKDWLEAVNQGLTHHSTHFYNVKFSDSEFIDWCLASNIVQYKKIVSRWERNLAMAKFKVFFYEDLQNNPDTFLSRYFNFCGLENVSIPGSNEPVNMNPRTVRRTLEFNDQQKNLINNEIQKFQQTTGRDLTGWLR